jgi:putative ABC transport system ATP-binding protein
VSGADRDADREATLETPRGTTLLGAAGITKTYRRGPEEVHALRGVDVELTVGEVCALMGPSGSGKTTLLNVLCGWERPDGGTLSWRGAPLEAPDRLPWTEMAIVPQDVALIEELSVIENIELPLRLSGRLDAGGTREAVSLVRQFGLEDLSDRPPAEASLGEQQRTAIARALVAHPRIVLADEATAHQDEQWVKGVLKALREAAAEGTTSLLATHSDEVLEHVDRLLVVRDGVLVEAPSP